MASKEGSIDQSRSSFLQNLRRRLVKRPADLAASEKLIRAADLSESQSNFLLGFQESPSKGSVFLLGCCLSSEQTASDVVEIVSKLRPGLIVAQVNDEKDFRRSVTSGEKELLEGPATSAWNVIWRTVSEGLHTRTFEERACMQVLASVFGATPYKHVLAAREAAAERKCAFRYASQLPGAVVAGESVKGRGTELGLKFLAREAAAMSFQKKGDDEAWDFPAFAVETVDLFQELDTLMKNSGLPWDAKPILQTQQLVQDINDGKEVSWGELAVASRFRLAVEMLRAALCLQAQSPEGAPAPEQTLARVPEEERDKALLACALKQAAEEHGTVVALVSAEDLAPLRKHWNTVLSPLEELRARSLLHTTEHWEGLSLSEEEQAEVEKEKLLALAITGAGFAAGGLAYVKGGATFSNSLMALLKMASWKNTSVGLVGLLKRKAAYAFGQVGVPKAAALAKAVAPKAGVAAQSLAPKTAAAAQVAAGKAAVSTKVAIAKAAGTAKKVNLIAQSVVGQVKSTALSAIRVTSYNVMQRSNFRRPGPWLLLAGSAATCYAAYIHGESLEAGLEVAPSAASLARLGRGCAHLERASEELRKTGLWPQQYNEVYRTLAQSQKGVK